MTPVGQTAADAIARVALRVPLLERVLVAGTRRPFFRRHLRLGAVAHGYARVLGRREIRVAEMDGYRFYVNVGEPLGVEPYFFGNSGAVWLTRALVGPGDVCVDAGANAGHYTFLCASIVGPTGRVIAFEPNPEFAELLRRSIGINAFGPVVEVVESALFSTSGETKRFFLSVNPTNSGTSSLVNHGWFLSNERTIEIGTIAFDDFARKAGIERFRLVKIDVERAEDALLAGARRTLAEGRIDFIIIEMYAGSPAQELLEQAGYRGQLLVPSERKLVDAERVERGTFGDFLYARPGLTVP